MHVDYHVRSQELLGSFNKAFNLLLPVHWYTTCSSAFSPLIGGVIALPVDPIPVGDGFLLGAVGLDFLDGRPLFSGELAPRPRQGIAWMRSMFPVRDVGDHGGAISDDVCLWVVRSVDDGRPYAGWVDRMLGMVVAHARLTMPVTSTWITEIAVLAK